MSSSSSSPAPRAVGTPSSKSSEAAYSPAVASQLDVGLSDARLAAIADQVDLLERHGFLAGPVDLDAFVAHEPLRAARELLVTAAT